MAAVGGILSGDQITAFIQQASAAYLAPANALQAQEKPIQAQIAALGKIESAVSGLQSALAGLADIGTLVQRTVTTSPNGIVSASVTNAASAATYDLTGIHLAQAQRLISSGSASASATLGSGSVTIKIGDGPARTIDVADGASSLTGIADAINQAGAGIGASVLYDGASYHLVLTGDATGSANAFTVSGSGGLAGFSYYQGASGLSQNRAAANAGFSLNGIAITSGSNTIAGVVPGLTLTLAASGSASVQVGESAGELDDAAHKVVTALNTVLQTINQNASYDPVSGAGPLFGDVGVQILRTSLLDLITNSNGIPGSADASYGSLAAIGFGVNKDGTVSLDDAVFQSASSSNYNAVAMLLGEVATPSNPLVKVHTLGAAQPGTYAINIATNVDGTVTGTVNGQAASGTGGILAVTGPGRAQGLALEIPTGATGALGTVTISQGLYGSMSSLVGAALASGTGSIGDEIASLNSSIDAMNRQIAAWQQQAQQQTLMLTRQFSAAQATLSQLSTVGNFLSTYFGMLSGGFGG
jgi:flagellar hook-associated protein 2